MGHLLPQKYLPQYWTFGLTVGNRKRSIIYKDSESAKAFGKHFKTIRKAQGLTQEELALEAEVERSTVRRLEAGRFNPTLDLLFVLAKCLKVHPKTLLDYEIGESL